MGIPTPTASKATQWKIKDQYGTIAVYTRSHINGCTLTDPNENHCSCPKWFYVNRRGEKTRQYAANTPSFAEACAKAKHEHDGWHPEIAAARVEKTKQERAKTPVKVAVPKFIAGKCADGILDGTRDLYRCYLGHVDEKTGKERGYLFLWLNEVNRTRGENRIEYMDQIDHDLIGELKEWVKKRCNDLTRKSTWDRIRGFFHWAHEIGMIAENPTHKHKSPKVKKGNRCGAFTDSQFEAILAAVPVYAGEQYAYGRLGNGNPLRRLLEQRLTIFVLLMRYAGMAIIDAILFCPFVDTDGLGLDDEGVLRYRRLKTNELAVVPIESQDLLDMVRAGIPLEKNTQWPGALGLMTSDPHRPFSPLDFDPMDKPWQKTVAARWAEQLKALFKIAGIDRIKTEVGFKGPHSHMFRDTFAKWHLNRHTDIRDLSKMLGHSSVQTTEQSYASWLKEDQQAMIDRVRNRNYSTNVVMMPQRKKA